MLWLRVGHCTCSKGHAEVREAAPRENPKPSLMEAKAIAAGNRVPETVPGEEAPLVEAECRKRTGG